MRLERLMIILCLVLLTAVTVQAQMTVEESYLQQSVETIIIKQQSRATNLETKLEALNAIGEAIANGNTSPEIREALEYLGIEGTINQTREAGRLVNNFPDVRARAAAHLGTLGTSEAVETLVKMGTVDNEPMVLTQVVKALGNIGVNEHDEISTTISFIFRKFHVLNPDNLLAMEVLNAYEKLAAANSRLDANSIYWVMTIAEDGRYTYQIREKAKETLANLRRINSQQSQNK